ncbi:MAG TPA: 1-acyl-sn-glycerol-3-phosphate acyltransferase [Chitinophagaceae bacterium]|nr:1-acyl-sn-glycerol-3-phosphate acyltransferase [Chitinophagaceae bacterium]
MTRNNCALRFLWKLYLKLEGWKAVNEFPNHLNKAVIIIAPHTYWKDFLIGIGFRSVLKIRNGKYLGKAELFRGPFGFIFRWLGGIPVDRFSKQGAVEQVVEKLNKADKLLIALSPEGTRKKVDKLRTGFYHIAKQANVPIVMIGLDYSKKELSVSQPFNPTDDEAADFRKIIEFFAPLKGYYPQQGMAHLVQEEINH